MFDLYEHYMSISHIALIVNMVHMNNRYCKLPDGETPLMLELWGMWSTPSWLLLPGPLWPGMVAPDRALSMG